MRLYLMLKPQMPNQMTVGLGLVAAEDEAEATGDIIAEGLRRSLPECDELFGKAEKGADGWIPIPINVEFLRKLLHKHFPTTALTKEVLEEDRDNWRADALRLEAENKQLSSDLSAERERLGANDK